MIQLTIWLIRGRPCFLSRLLWVLYTTHMESTMLSIWNTKHRNKREGGERLIYISERILQTVLEQQECGEKALKLHQLPFLRLRLRVRTLTLNKGHPFTRMKWGLLHFSRVVLAYIITLLLPRHIRYWPWSFLKSWKCRGWNVYSLVCMV